jgi:hypothetical protein
MNNSFTIDGRELKYKITWYTSEWGEYVETEFFETCDIKKRKEWIFWGKEYEIIIPHTIFTVYKDFHSPKLTKEYWRREIRKQLVKYDSLKNREDEIKNGEFI